MFSPSVKQECHTVSTDRPQNYNGIDLMKFLCAILVFIAHVPPFQGEVSSLAKYVNFGLQHCICRLAVPFYFVSSGFFLFGKMSPDDLNTDAIKHYCFKLLRLLGTWYVLLFAGGTEHLWYLGATVVAVVLLCLCFRFHMRFRYIGVLACLLYGVGLLGDAYSGVIAPLENHAVLKYFFKVFELIFPTTRNGIFMGFIFVFMGAAIAQRKISLKPGTALIGFGISVVCLIAEVFLLKTSNMLRQYNMYVFLPPAAFFLFSFACTVRLKDRAVYKRLRKLGMVIYFTHLLINRLVSLAIGTVDARWSVGLVQYQFVFSLFFTLLFAICVERLSRRDKFKWINWLLS